jgi:hypothetical protein
MDATLHDAPQTVNRCELDRLKRRVGRKLTPFRYRVLTVCLQHTVTLVRASGPPRRPFHIEQYGTRTFRGFVVVLPLGQHPEFGVPVDHFHTQDQFSAAVVTPATEPYDFGVPDVDAE